jgi:hypothetical protein
VRWPVQMRRERLRPGRHVPRCVFTCLAIVNVAGAQDRTSPLLDAVRRNYPEAKLGVAPPPNPLTECERGTLPDSLFLLTGPRPRWGSLTVYSWGRPSPLGNESEWQMVAHLSSTDDVRSVDTVAAKVVGVDCTDFIRVVLLERDRRFFSVDASSIPIPIMLMPGDPPARVFIRGDSGTLRMALRRSRERGEAFDLAAAPAAVEPKELAGVWWSQVGTRSLGYGFIVNLFADGRLRVDVHREESCSKPDPARGVTLHGICDSYQQQAAGRWELRRGAAGDSLCFVMPPAEKNWKSECAAFTLDARQDDATLQLSTLGAFLRTQLVPPPRPYPPSFRPRR